MGQAFIQRACRCPCACPRTFIGWPNSRTCPDCVTHARRLKWRAYRARRMAEPEFRERQREYKRRYAGSPRGKIVQGLYYDAHREAKIAAERAAYRRRRAALPPRIVRCAGSFYGAAGQLRPCQTRFVRTYRSKRLYCDPCFEALHGRWKAKRRSPTVLPGQPMTA